VNWHLFVMGWQRRNAAILDTAGCPRWLNRRRCHRIPELGRVARALEKAFPDSTIEERQEKFLKILLDKPQHL